MTSERLLEIAALMRVGVKSAVAKSISANLQRAAQLAADDGDLVDVAGCLDAAWIETGIIPLDDSVDIDRWANVRNYLYQAQIWVRVWANGGDATAREIIAVLCELALGCMEVPC